MMAAAAGGVTPWLVEKSTGITGLSPGKRKIIYKMTRNYNMALPVHS
jgi:hypothetical protein